MLFSPIYFVNEIFLIHKTGGMSLKLCNMSLSFALCKTHSVQQYFILAIGGSRRPSLMRKYFKWNSVLKKVICTLKMSILLIIHEHYLTGTIESIECEQ